MKQGQTPPVQAVTAEGRLHCVQGHVVHTRDASQHRKEAREDSGHMMAEESERSGRGLQATRTTALIQHWLSRQVHSKSSINQQCTSHNSQCWKTLSRSGKSDRVRDCIVAPAQCRLCIGGRWVSGFSDTCEFPSQASQHWTALSTAHLIRLREGSRWR